MTTIIIIIYNYIFCVYDVGVKWFARIVHDLLRILLLHFLFTLSSPREGKSLCTAFGFSFKVCVHVINHVGAIIYKLNPFFQPNAYHHITSNMYSIMELYNQNPLNCINIFFLSKYFDYWFSYYLQLQYIK